MVPALNRVENLITSKLTENKRFVNVIKTFSHRITLFPIGDIFLDLRPEEKTRYM